MKASKTLASLVAAAAVAGSIGLAYAQTATPDTTTSPATSTTPSTMGNQGTTTTTPSTSPSTSPSGMPTTTERGGMQMERPAQADRN